MLKACKEGPLGVLSLATARLSDSGDRPGFFQALPTRCLAGVERQGGERRVGKAVENRGTEGGRRAAEATPVALGAGQGRPGLGWV